MAYTKERICTECSKIETVRKDNKSSICKSCASRNAGAKGLITIRKNIKYKSCAGCSNKIESYKKWDYCSVECSSKNKRVERECKECKIKFKILKSTLKTNASGNFCSRPCYEKYLCDTERINGRGSRWKKIRKEALSKFPFCALCGTSKKLQVHHIIPYRYTYDNSQSNLIPLCVNHHKIVEIQTNNSLKETTDYKTAKIILNSILREKQLNTLTVLKRLKSESL